MQQFDSIFPDEFKLFIQSHDQFSKRLDAKAVTLFANASSLSDIRAIYTGKQLEELIQDVIREAPSNADDLINISRMIIKWCARDRMLQLGFASELENIHRDNIEKYGNPVGPKPSFLNQKYGNNSKEIAEASKRFRPDTQVFGRR